MSLRSLTQIIAVSAALVAPALSRGQNDSASKVVYRVDMASPEVQAMPLPAGFAWEKTGPEDAACLKAHVSPQGDTSRLNALTIPVDLRPWRGQVMLMRAKVKAQDVSQPDRSYYGVKCMLAFKTPSTGEHWLGQGSLFGSFDFRQTSVVIPVPEDATDAKLYLGLQNCSGTAWFTDVEFIAWRTIAERPALPEDPGPVYRGHDLPRLRGVMSPHRFSEEDFATLQEWNVNLVRWQITRNWGKTGQNLDLKEYDRWMNQELEELDQAADAAQRHGIKLIVDIHSPPGGRMSDRSMRMFLEKPYQEHFIELWEKIAFRYKYHPAIWAYDLINEPVQLQPSPEGVNDWLGTQIAAAKAIRAIDPDTAISITVDGWSNPSEFRWLAPVDIPNVIYQVHMYQPGEYTHQGVHNSWGETAASRQVDYPGVIHGKPFDKDYLRDALQPVRQFQLDTNAHIYVGEFSVVRWAPGASRYLDDLISIFEEYGWDWTYHSFREWPGWSLEHANLPADPKTHVLAKETTDRAKVLFKYFSLNEHPSEAEEQSVSDAIPLEKPPTDGLEPTTP